MSDEKHKKVIHVKDLLIKADNVHIEQPRRPHWNPFLFGPRRVAREADTQRETRGKEAAHDADYSSADGAEHPKKPFSWI